MPHSFSKQCSDIEYVNRIVQWSIFILSHNNYVAATPITFCRIQLNGYCLLTTICLTIQRKLTACFVSLEKLVHRCNQGGQKGHAPKFLAYLVILCFERRCHKQHTVARLKSKIPPPNFGSATLYWLGESLQFSSKVFELIKIDRGYTCLCSSLAVVPDFSM